ncbi:MAG: CPBP family glutamic-type intramembrane protease [Planctomycetia bacterium]|nr:CPBP family glutamic-type intramembrane protease [Planctomycetia bacterium]
MSDFTFLKLFLSVFLTLVPLIGFFTVWSWIFFRVFALKQPLFLPHHPLRRARWSGAFCFLVFGIFFLFPSVLIPFFSHETTSNMESVITSDGVLEEILETLGESENPAVIIEKVLQCTEKDHGTEHVAVRYLQENPSFAKFFFMFLYAAILVPILEEFLFRLVLQGWCDAREREIFRRRRGNGWRSMILVSLLFALVHFHAAGDFQEESVQKLQFTVSALSACVVLLAGFSVLHSQLMLTWREVGLDFRYWREDVALGTYGFFAGAFPTYVIQRALTEPLKEYCSADFIALVPIALVFGFLYWRTRRLLPSIFAHCLYNSYALVQLVIYVCFT